MKYPISHNQGQSISEKFIEILKFHIPPSQDKTILDPTCGRRYIWSSILGVHNYDLDGSEIPLLPWHVIFSDIEDFGYNKVSNIMNLELDRVDGIVYDPPYFFGYEDSSDKRREDYGDYCQTYESLLWYMDVANDKLSKMLMSNGKLIVKCADQYNVKERKFYPLHIEWANRLKNFELIDFYVCIHHHMNPTAFQVKDRPCSVIMHTYFMVFKLKER